MKKILLLTIWLVACAAGSPLGAQERRQAETMQAEKVAASVVLTVKENRVRVQNAPSDARLEVYSILGVKQKSVRIESVDQTVTLNLPRGFYILKVENVVRKVVIR